MSKRPDPASNRQGRRHGEGHRDHRPAGRRPSPAADDEDGPVLLFGVHAVEAALRKREAVKPGDEVAPWRSALWQPRSNFLCIDRRGDRSPS